MCEFCHKHGEGKKWYLEANNYSEDLLSDLRRREFIIDFIKKPESLGKGMRRLKDLDHAPGFVKRAIIRRVSNKMKKVHYGQVVPIEEIERIFEFVTSVARFACICRHVSLGSEQRYCFGVSMAPKGGELARIVREIDASYLTGPHTAGIEEFSKEEALSFMRKQEQEGLCHTVWTFIAPFIGGICNCDRSDCLAMRTTVMHGLPVMFRAEYVARTDPDLCNGCRLCMRVCQFGAIGYSAALEKSSIDPRRCYGCGICRSVCTREAISLIERSDVPVAKSLW
jgi:ferredoxin